MRPPGFGLPENGNSRPQMMMATGGIGILPAPPEAWDSKAMAAHRLRILVAENPAQRMEMDAHIQEQACPPGCRPPLLLSELPPNMFRPPSACNEVLLPQSCPPTFRPPVRHVESARVMQPEMKFRGPDSMMYRPEFRLDDRPGDFVGIHDTMRGPSMYGAADRHGWYPNESPAGAGRVLESRFVDPLPRETQDEQVRNSYSGAELENEHWRRETLLPNGQLITPSVPVPPVTQPLAYNPGAFWPANMRGENLASTWEGGKPRSVGDADDSPRTPPFKRLRIGHELDSVVPAWARSKIESEMAWLNGLRMSDDRSRDHEAYHPSSRDRNRAPTTLEVSQKSEFRSTPSSFRAISQSDKSSFLASPRPVYSNRNSSCFDTRSRPLSPESRSSRFSERARSPIRCSNYNRQSSKVGERSWRRDSWPPRSLGGKSSSGAETDTQGAHRRSAEVPGEAERKTENGSLTSLHSSRVVEEHAKDDGSRCDSQFVNIVTEVKSEQRDAEGNVAQEAHNSLESVSTDRIKNEKPFSLPLREDTVRKLPKTKRKAERCESLERNLPLHRNGSQLSTEKGDPSSAKYMMNSGENRSASAEPASATSLKITRYFTNVRSTPKHPASQHSEMDWRRLPANVTPWRQRTVVVSAGPSSATISGSHAGAALQAEEQDGPEEGEILQAENRSKSLLGSTLSLERSSTASETGTTEGCLIKPFVAPSRISSEVTAHPPGVVHGTNSQVVIFSNVGFCGDKKEGRKWISTGIRSAVGVKPLSDSPSVPASELTFLDKEQETCTAGEFKSDVDSFKNSASVSETPNSKLPFMAEKSLLQESTVHGQNLERDLLVNSGTEGQFRSSYVEDVKVKPFVGTSGPLLDDWLFGITSSIPLATETDKVFNSNGSTSGSLQISVKSELQDSLTSDGEKQPSALVIKKTTSVVELAKVVVDKKQAGVVQEKPDTKVVPQPSDLRKALAIGDRLAGQPNREGTQQGNSTRKMADAGSPLVTEKAKVMNVVSRRYDLQDLRYPGGHPQVEERGKVTVGGSGLVTNLVQVEEATPSDSDDDFDVITEPPREVAKRRKIMHPERRGNLKQVTIAGSSPATVKKTDLFEQINGTGGTKADSTLMKKHMPSLTGGIQHSAPFLNTIDMLPLSSRLSVSSAQTPPSRTVGRSYMSNKTWRRDANSQQFSNALQNPAVVAQPSTYIRKKFSIIRNPAPQVPQSNVSARPNALSRFPQGSVAPFRNKTYSLSASKSMVQHPGSSTVEKTAVVASGSPGLKTSDSKRSERGAMSSENPSPSPVERLHSPGDETSVPHSEPVVSESPLVSQISPSKPSRCEGVTLASSPASKTPGGATIDATVGYVVSGTRLYRKRKADEVHIGPSTTSASPILKSGSEKSDVPLGYIKRKTNQLVRCDHPEASANDALQNVVEGGDQVKFMNKQRRHSSQLKTKTKLGRVLSQKRGRLLGLARVWTLNNEGKHTTNALSASRDWRYPLFPWKRSAVAAPRLRRGRPLHEGKMGALFFHISQLQKYRPAHPVYTRSADGFSLHRSGVVSKSGANLKWTKSLKTRSILASEAATKVVAEAEKKKRDKKVAVVMAVAKARDERRAKLRSGFVNPSSVSSLKPLGIGGAVYVRKGFGNQLVRNSKTVARAVASEKFRWSLRNARLRRAKKQSYCVYYTRFGVCKRGDGKCLYIHDPEKIAVCTKFLRGSCSDPACRLTHKVIPERMSDCSYFLEGLCTNESCPYRHVNVNKEAPVCKAFLQGYCADGVKCNKKHTYVCPEYTLTGSCSSSNCKLRHPKKAKQGTPASKESADAEKEAQKGSKRELQKGRYFTLPLPAEGEHQGQPVSTANAVGDKIAESGDALVDFISIDEYDSESSKEYQ